MAEKIDLTEQQKADLYGVAQMWERSLCSTELADRDRAEFAVRELYRLSRFNQPVILWVESIMELLWLSKTLGGAYAHNRLDFFNKMDHTPLINFERKIDSVTVSSSSVSQESKEKVTSELEALLDWRKVKSCIANTMNERFDNWFEPYKWKNQLGTDPNSLASMAYYGSSYYFRIEAQRVVNRLQMREQELRRRLGIDSLTVDLVPFLGGQFSAHTAATCQAVTDGVLWQGTALTDVSLLHLRDTIFDLIRSSGPFIPYEGVAVLCERPMTVKWGQEEHANRLHYDHGPAVQYRNGDGVYMIDGIPVPRRVVESPQSLSVSEVLTESNQEVRRIMLNQYPPERFIREAGGHVVNKSKKWGELWKCDAWKDDRGWVRGRRRFEPLCMLHVKNATLEADGTRHEFWIRVPPRYKTARGAVAWTFQTRRNEYNPVQQS